MLYPRLIDGLGRDLGFPGIEGANTHAQRRVSVGLGPYGDLRLCVGLHLVREALGPGLFEAQEIDHGYEAEGGETGGDRD